MSENSISIGNQGQRNNQKEVDEFPIAAEDVALPSEGRLYKNGKKSVRVKYLGAPEDDILYSTDLIKSNRVFDALLQAIVLDSDMRTEDLTVGDKNAILINARINGYGPEYKHDEITCKSCNESFEPDVDLSLLVSRGLDTEPDENFEFDYILPTMNIPIKFRILNVEDENYLSKIMQSGGNQKKNSKYKVAPIITERYLRQIMQVRDRREKLYTRKMIEVMPTKDSLAFREYVKLVTPGIDLNYEVECPHCASKFTHELTLNPVRMFYPGANI